MFSGCKGREKLAYTIGKPKLGILISEIRFKRFLIIPKSIYHPDLLGKI